MKNTGKFSENLFDRYWLSLGKRAHLHKFIDAAGVFGRNRKRYGSVPINFPAQPSDRLITYSGKTFFAEIKSSHNKNRFPFSIIQKNQWSVAKQVLTAGGEYDFFVHNLITNKWYRIPSAMIDDYKNRGKASIPWLELKGHRWCIQM